MDCTSVYKEGLLTYGSSTAASYYLSNEKRKERSRLLISVCECGRTYGARRRLCECGRETHFVQRFVPYDDGAEYAAIDHDRLVDFLMDIEWFVRSLIGTTKVVAKMWLLDRYDLWYDNYQRRIGEELGITPQAVAKHVRKIRRLFREWYA